jgi:hypothetical protein
MREWWFVDCPVFSTQYSVPRKDKGKSFNRRGRKAFAEVAKKGSTRRTQRLARRTLWYFVLFVEKVLLSHHFHKHALGALAVELGVKDALPGAEVESALRHRNDHLMVNEDRFQVRVTVVLAGLVVLVVLLEGCEFFHKRRCLRSSPLRCRSHRRRR